jgi:kinesin family protein 18/19
MAYGSTGAGKTYTMLGTGEQPGIMAKSLADLFTLIENSKNRYFKLRFSYIEVYNESIRDLTNKKENLELREDPVKGTIIIGVNELEVTNSSEVFKLLLKGNNNRTTESTNANETSSRSHAILQINMENKLKSNNNTETINSKFILVDLAGSERAGNSKNTGIRQTEGSNINKSLLALGNCINALADNKDNSFIPWRDSKLTRILKVKIYI